jgi:PKD repeat protein
LSSFIFEGCKKDDTSPSEIEGCTDESATNYNEDATIDDGSCLYDNDDILGCMDPLAVNYNEEATIDDGSCEYINLPIANFSWNLESNEAPILVSFTNYSANSDTYIWDFGDGESSSEENPVHLYQSGGDYTVSLTSSISEEHEDLKVEIITIANAPSKLIINKIRIVDMPLTNNGSDWDDGVFGYQYPDVYYSLMDGGNELCSSSSQDNIDALPIEFTENLPYTLNDLTREYSIELWDNDILVGLGSNEYIGLCSFTPSNYIPLTGDEEYLIGIPVSPNDGIIMVLEVEWTE